MIYELLSENLTSLESLILWREAFYVAVRRGNFMFHFKIWSKSWFSDLVSAEQSKRMLSCEIPLLFPLFIRSIYRALSSTLCYPHQAPYQYFHTHSGHSSEEIANVRFATLLMGLQQLNIKNESNMWSYRKNTFIGTFLRIYSKRIARVGEQGN